MLMRERSGLSGRRRGSQNPGIAIGSDVAAAAPGDAGDCFVVCECAPVAVNVKVRVAESGTVMLAEVEDYGDPPNWRLAAAALDAARRWTFEPARVEDTAVPSDVILHFRFTP